MTFKMPKPIGYANPSVNFEGSVIRAIPFKGYMPVYTTDALRDVLEQAAKCVNEYMESIRLFQNESQLIEAERRIRGMMGEIK